MAAKRNGRPRARLRGDDGAAMVETAIVSPLIVLVFLAIFEFGLLLRDQLGANDAVAAGAKYGAIQGPDMSPVRNSAGVEVGSVTADFTAVFNTRAGLAGVDPQMIERIVVFKAQSAAAGSALDQVPADCKTSSASIIGKCNVYLMPDAFWQIQQGNLSYFSCPGGTSTNRPCGWNPTSRSDGPGLNNIDYLGVYVKLRRMPISGLIPVADTIEVAAINRLEPGQTT